MAKVLRKRYPNAHIAMLIKRYTREIAEDDGAIDQLIFYDDENGLVPLTHLVATLRGQKFDIVFHTYPRFRLALVTWIARIPLRVGTGYRWYSFLFNRKVYDHRKDAKFHELEYNLRLLKSIGMEVDAKDVPPEMEVRQPVLDSVRLFLRERGIPDSSKIVIIHPGSGGSAREWSARKFGELAAKLLKHEIVRVVITGGKREQNLVDEVRNIAGEGAISVVNALNLREYAALAKRASLFIGNSTGPLHIAAAVGTPVVGLYPQVTALSAARWGPFTERKTLFIPKDKPINCDQCVVKKSKICDCMETISVDEVYAGAVKYL